jgi:hypothetical protein
MNPINRLTSTCALLAGVAGTVSSASAVTMLQQAPCPGICKIFNTNQLPVVVRSMTFNVANPGKHTAIFNGSMVCAGPASIGAYNVNLNSQIVTAAGAVVNAVGPGGLKLNASTSGAADVPFNLASNRVLVSAGGQNTVIFKIAKTSMDPGVQCFVYNASFTIITIP